MNNQTLNELLKRATVPERGQGYWEQFPSQVMAEVERRRNCGSVPARPAAESPSVSVFRALVRKPALGLGIAGLCLVLGFVLGSWNAQRPHGGDPQVAEARKYFHELEAMFPKQLQAIVFDQQGTHLMLAPEADVPTSTPLYLKVCGPEGCRRFVTFSGQQISLNGDACDVLVDHQGHVLVVGRQVVWSSAQASAQAGAYTIEAKPLQTAS